MEAQSCHYESEKCRIGEARRIWKDTLQQCFDESWVPIQVNVEPLEPEYTFPYLDCTITYNNSDWATVYHNLWKARQRWGMISNVLTKTGAMVRARGMLYKVVAQTVILYGSGSWVVTGAMLKLLEGFHIRAA